MCNQAMKKFLFILTAVLQAAIAGAQQVDTTGYYSERRDTLKAASVTVRRDLEHVQESDRNSKNLLLCVKRACDPNGHGLFPSATVRRQL